jgi:ankyrin repeat protein
LALQHGQADNARLLIDRGADIHAKNKNGWTPLMYAFRYNQAENGRLLIEKGAEIDYTVAEGWTPLLTALRNNQAENARILILKGANPKARLSSGWTALHFALDHDQPENAALLIQKGADLSARNDKGDTPLSLARKKGYGEIIKLLGGEPEGKGMQAAFDIPTYSRVLKTYPKDARICTTDISVESVTDGQWTTLGIVEYYKHEKQQKCYGIKVVLKVPVTIDGVVYKAGTKLTVDKDLRWTEVASWD